MRLRALCREYVELSTRWLRDEQQDNGGNANMRLQRAATRDRNYARRPHIPS